MMSDTPPADKTDKTAASATGERLHKLLAAAGVDSRRKCEELVTAGRVTVDGKVVTKLASRVDPDEQDVRLDGERVRPQKKRYYLLNKPPGYLCTNSDPARRKLAVELLPPSETRLFSVGRLDEDSQGLLVMTNDGELAQKLAHPKFEVPRVYRIQVSGIPSPQTLTEVQKGLYFTEGKFRVRRARRLKTQGQSAFLEIELTQGQNREIRRLFARVGHKVIWLQRIAFGPLKLGTLPVGRFRPLKNDEVKALHQFATGSETPACKPAGRKTMGRSTTGRTTTGYKTADAHSTGPKRSGTRTEKQTTSKRALAARAGDKRVSGTPERAPPSPQFGRWRDRFRLTDFRWVSPPGGVTRSAARIVPEDSRIVMTASAPSPAGMCPQAVQTVATVVAQEEMARDTFRLRLRCPELARRILSGQFVMLRPTGGSDPLLGRPFALFDTFEERGVTAGVEIGYLVIGKMTAEMARWRPGQQVRLWGPLGNGFPPPPAGRLLLVAGGIGQTPFLAVARDALGVNRYGSPPRILEHRPTQLALLYGVRSAAYLAGVDDFTRDGIDVRIATDDGSAGRHGYVTALLQEELAANPPTRSQPVTVYCCGPRTDDARRRGPLCRRGRSLLA